MRCDVWAEGMLLVDWVFFCSGGIFVMEKEYDNLATTTTTTELWKQNGEKENALLENNINEIQTKIIFVSNNLL